MNNSLEPKAAEEPTLNLVQQAVLEFLQAETDAAARELLTVKEDLLLTLDARRLLESYVEAYGKQNAEVRAHLEARLALWHKVRLGPKPEASQTPLTTPPELITSGRTGELETQVPGKAKYWIIEASNCAIGDNAQTLNILNVGRVPLQWQKPQQFRTDLTESAVGRIGELNDLHERLQSGASAAVVGKGISRGASGAVRGIPGVGKSTLAALYAEQYAEHYPGGIIWLQLGPSYTTAESVGPVISELAAFAYSGDVQAYRALSLAQPATTPEQALDSLKHAIFKPEAVKLLLSGHGPLLIIVDDVWGKAVLKPIRAARPHDASLLVTTRDSRVANQIGNALELDVLSEEDALEMISERLPGMEVPLAKHLAEVVGYHPLALEIALGDLAERDQEPEDWPDCIAKIGRLVDTGESLDFLPLSDDTDREQRLAAVLRYSYDALGQRPAGETLQRHFRALGTFAREADFATVAVATLWRTDEEPTKEHLLVFRTRSLLSGRAGQWRQHSILRSYALHLQDNSERLPWAERHAEYYLARMREAYDENQFYRMAPELPNLRHAFDWAVQEGLGLAQDLLVYSTDLLRSQNLGEEYLAWAQRVLDRARHIGGNKEIGRAFNSLGHALQTAATLIYGKDRGARLREALKAYEEALALRRDVPLQYATTQNDRAVLLCDLAGLPGEDRGARLREALKAYEEALALRRDVPLQYATTQNNRAVLLCDLAGLPGEDRGARLREALKAYEEALALQRDVPLQDATTQNNRALLLRDLAGLPGEDRGARLREALKAYEEALARCRDVPLQYATTQNNRALLLRDLAGLPGEDRGARLREALVAAIQAVELFEQYQHAEYLRVGRQTLAGVIVTLGASEARAFLQALCPEKPLPPLTQGELLEVLAWEEGIQTKEEWQSRLESDADFQARVTELMAFATEAAAAAQLVAEQLIEWIKTPDLQRSQAYLEEHAGILLTDAGEVVLQMLLENSDNNPTIAQYLALLRRCREIGIPETYREIEAQDD